MTSSATLLVTTTSMQIRQQGDVMLCRGKSRCVPSAGPPRPRSRSSPRSVSWRVTNLVHLVSDDCLNEFHQMPPARARLLQRIAVVFDELPPALVRCNTRSPCALQSQSRSAAPLLRYHPADAVKQAGGIVCDDFENRIWNVRCQCSRSARLPAAKEHARLAPAQRRRHVTAQPAATRSALRVILWRRVLPEEPLLVGELEHVEDEPARVVIATRSECPCQ